MTAVLDQAAPVLDALPADAPLVWLYEPAWTGGAGAPAPYPQIAEVAAALRERRAGRTGDTRVLYGGAVTPGVLTRALAADAGLHGVGIGRAAHEPAQPAAVTVELLDLLASREEGRRPRPPEGADVNRPVTLTTVQWTDVPLPDHCRDAAGWGYDGLALACHPRHFDVERARADPAPWTRCAPSSTATACASTRSPRTCPARRSAPPSTGATRASCRPASGATASPRTYAAAPPRP